jgi:hypothetical protein
LPLTSLNKIASNNCTLKQTTMKKILALLLTLFVTSAMAQKSVGVRGSFTTSTMNKFDLIENITPDLKYLPSVGGAVFIEIPITSNFSIQPELAFTQKGFSIKEGFKAGGDFLGIDIPINGKVNFRTNYIEVPVLAKYHFGNKDAAHYYVAAGPSIGYMADASMNIRVLNIFPIKTGLSNDIFKPFELSGVAVVGFEVPVAENAMVFVEGRYQQGISRAIDTPIFELPVRNKTFGGGIGLRFNI